MNNKLSKLTALVLALVLLLTAFPAQAIQTKPASPDWWSAEDYLSFEGDPFYEGGGWELVLTIRQEILDQKNIFSSKVSPSYEKLRTWGIKNDKNSPAFRYEWALLDLGAYCTGLKDTTTNAGDLFDIAADLLEENHPYRRILKVWYLRCFLMDGDFQRNDKYALSVRDVLLARFDKTMTEYSITFEELRDHPIMARVPQATWDDTAAQLAKHRVEYPIKQAEKEARRAAEQAAREAEEARRAAEQAELDRKRIKIFLDGAELEHPDVQPYILDGRTMVPVYQLTQALGGKADWDGTTRMVTLTRAGDTVKMTIGNKTAYVNDQPVVMDVAPCISNSRTMIPAAYAATFFGQNVKWDGETRSVFITENKSVAKDSNLEAWALPMGAMLSSINSGNPSRFGLFSRGSTDEGSLAFYHYTPYKFCRDRLSDGWGIENREDLIETVISMTFNGHNSSFLVDAAILKSLSAAEYRQLLSQAQGMDAYMWPYTKQLSEKWGDRGILCWDLFRMSNLVQWGYTAGYITYEEALALIEPAATLLQKNFSSWKEAYENYLDGYNWWSRNNVLNQDVWKTERGVKYQKIKEEHGSIFDDSLFKTGVIPLSDLSAEDIIADL